MRFSLILIAICFLLSCKQQPKVLVIQPLGDFPVVQAEKVLEEVSHLYPYTMMKKNIPFPARAYYKERGRYRADTLIRFLKENIGEDSVIVGLSSKDISTTKNGVKDWGIMGLGYRPGNSCVVSTYRLSDKSREEQFFKVVLHEIGHTQGLNHCPEQTCFMRDAEGGNPLDEETGFCERCKDKMKAKGWQLN